MKLLLMNNPALRQVCEEVKPEELDFIKSQLSEMKSILQEEHGYALAANQVGIIKRFFLMKDGRVVINPVIIEKSTEEPFDEGCLSIPGVSAITRRSKYVKIRYKNLEFKDVEEEFKDVDAVAIQHEIDHLDGKLYIDQLGPVKRMMVLDKYRKYSKMKERQR